MLDFWQPFWALAAAVPCFVLAYTLMSVWRDPESVEEGRWVGFGVNIFVMEFLVIHSGFMLGVIAMEGGRGVALALGCFIVPAELVFAWAIAHKKESRPLFWSFVALIAGRLAVIFFDGDEATELVVTRAMVSVFIYFPAVFITIGDLLPKWGMTDPAYAKALQANGETGVWVEHPHRAIGAAAIYFFLLGSAELLILSWVPV